MTREQLLKPRRSGTQKYSSRSTWLLRAIDMLDNYFNAIGQPIPDVTIQAAWPDGKPAHETVGWCYSNWIEDKGIVEEVIYTKIFIAPDIIENIQVLETLVHELVHAAVFPKLGESCSMYEIGHGSHFSIVAAQVGLEGKMTSTHGNLKLLFHLLNISNTLGLYPEREE